MKEKKEMNPIIITERLPQAKEMEAIWETADDVTRAYLRGCIMTAQALAEKKAG